MRLATLASLMVVAFSSSATAEQVGVLDNHSSYLCYNTDFWDYHDFNVGNISAKYYTGAAFCMGVLDYFHQETYFWNESNELVLGSDGQYLKNDPFFLLETDPENPASRRKMYQASALDRNCSYRSSGVPFADGEVPIADEFMRKYTIGYRRARLKASVVRDKRDRDIFDQQGEWYLAMWLDSCPSILAPLINTPVGWPDGSYSYPSNQNNWFPLPDPDRFDRSDYSCSKYCD